MIVELPYDDPNFGSKAWIVKDVMLQQWAAIGKADLCSPAVQETAVDRLLRYGFGELHCGYVTWNETSMRLLGKILSPLSDTPLARKNRERFDARPLTTEQEECIGINSAKELWQQLRQVKVELDEAKTRTKELADSNAELVGEVNELGLKLAQSEAAFSAVAEGEDCTLAHRERDISELRATVKRYAGALKAVDMNISLEETFSYSSQVMEIVREARNEAALSEGTNQ